jgi:hypothetical protein
MRPALKSFVAEMMFGIYLNEDDKVSGRHQMEPRPSCRITTTEISARYDPHAQNIRYSLSGNLNYSESRQVSNPGKSRIQTSTSNLIVIGGSSAPLQGMRIHRDASLQL